MLKTISLYSIFLLAHFSSSFAQSPKEHFILGTYHVYANQKSSLLGKIRSGSYLYVRANSPNSAMRYGIGIGERVQNVRNYR